MNKTPTITIGIATSARVLGRELESGSTILVARKAGEEGVSDEDAQVDITVIPAEVTPERITVPPTEPEGSAQDDDEPEPDAE